MVARRRDRGSRTMIPGIRMLGSLWREEGGNVTCRSCGFRPDLSGRPDGELQWARLRDCIMQHERVAGGLDRLAHGWFKPTRLERDVLPPVNRAGEVTP